VKAVPGRVPRQREGEKLIRKLESIGFLSDDEKSAVYRIPMQVRRMPARYDIARDGDEPSRSFLLLSGLVCRYKLVRKGKRQIFSFHTPGDIPDLQSLHLNKMDHSLCTLSKSTVAYIAHGDLHQIIGAFPRLGALFWRDTLIDAAIFREWMLGLGRRTGHQRIAHLLCEMSFRFKAIGLTHGHNYIFPVTQSDLADALGLTMVHVNRVLRSLREDKIVTIEREKVLIYDWERLIELADFETSYLHQKEEMD
jgi:CRP-like cAMP-binding protein